MAVAPGKYNDLCTEIRERFKADGVLVLVINGSRGTGQSMQMTPAHMLAFLSALEGIKDAMAEDLRTIIKDASAEGAALLKTLDADEGKPQ